jgi:hypothetical protein
VETVQVQVQEAQAASDQEELVSNGLYQKEEAEAEEQDAEGIRPDLYLEVNFLL